MGRVPTTVGRTRYGYTFGFRDGTPIPLPGLCPSPQRSGAIPLTTSETVGAPGWGAKDSSPLPTAPWWEHATLDSHAPRPDSKPRAAQSRQKRIRRFLRRVKVRH
jgi:hypothetical protein